MKKLEITFAGRVFSDDKSAWLYVDGFVSAKGLLNWHWRDIEFSDNLIVGETTFKSMKDWVECQE